MVTDLILLVPCDTDFFGRTTSAALPHFQSPHEHADKTGKLRATQGLLTSPITPTRHQMKESAKVILDLDSETIHGDNATKQ